MGYIFIAMTILLTIYGQLILKWQVGIAGPLPIGLLPQIWFILTLLLRPWVISALVSAFAASLFWMATMTKFELSRAYPFMALNFVLVTLIAVPLFGESVSMGKVLGIVLVTAGLVLLSRG